MSKKRILIVGGGIAGTAVASLLQDSYEITLIEKGEDWRTIGYAVGVWKSGLKILKKFNFPQSFWQITFPSVQGAIFGSKGQKLVSLSYPLISDGNVTLAITRESLLKSLISTLHNVDVRFSTTAIKVENDGEKVDVIFSNGNKEIYDLVVGADGVHSQVRSLVFGPKPLKSYNWYVWYGYMNRDSELLSGWYALTSEEELLLSFPTNEKVNTVALCCSKSKFKKMKEVSSLEDLKKVFSNLNPFLKEGIDSIENFDDLFFSELFFVDMKRWYKQRVVLAGDAKHGRSPASGMGSTLALEDAYVLSDELLKNISIDIALKRYEKRRQRRVSFILRWIDLFERNVMNKSNAEIALRDLILPVMPTKLFIHTMKKIFNKEA